MCYRWQTLDRIEATGAETSIRNMRASESVEHLNFNVC